MSGGGGSCGAAMRAVLRNQCEARESQDRCLVFLDLNNPRPSDQELPIFELADNVARCARVQLRDLAEYGKGASEEIRVAMNNPDDVALQKCTSQLLARLVCRLRNYYELSLRIEKVMPLLLWELCSGPLPPAEHLETNQALCKQLAHLIDFVLRFDSIKIATPALQNDFSFYRRVISRDQVFSSDCVPAEQAGAVSLFLASPTPMLAALISSVDQFHRVHAHLPIENTTDTLAAIIEALQFMLESSERLSADDEELCLRVMVGCILLFDHVHPVGAFSRSSPLDIRAVVRLLKEHPRSDVTENLLNTMRYTTKHLNDATTPKAIRSLLQ